LGPLEETPTPWTSSSSSRSLLCFPFFILHFDLICFPCCNVSYLNSIQATAAALEIQVSATPPSWADDNEHVVYLCLDSS
jgi:hypothetical protein